MENRLGEGTEKPAGRRSLGQTDIQITPIGLGAWQFSQGKGGAIGTWSPITPEDTDSIVSSAYLNGINWFDTAELYGFGRSEAGLSRALQAAGVQNGDVVIATKWNPLMRFAGSIRTTARKRLKFLEPFGIDLHQVHFPASFSSVEAEMDAMADLVEKGVIRSVGVSNFSASQMRRASQQLKERGLPLASNQVKYSLLDRKIERNGILETAKRLGVTIIAYSPLEMGLLTGKFHKDADLLRSRPFARRIRLSRLIEKSQELLTTLEEIAEDHGASVSQVALNWLINFHGETVVTIPGASKPHHAEESAKAMTVECTPSELARIEKLSRGFI